MEWLNIYGLATVALIMIPNIIYAVKCKDGFQNKWKNRLVEILEQVGRYGAMAFMVFNIPGTSYGCFSYRAFLAYLIVNFTLVAIYIIIWIVCWKKNNLFRALALSIIPSVIFIFSGIMHRSILLFAFSLIFAPTHILISYKNAR